jgi:hypothetical protein
MVFSLLIVAASPLHAEEHVQTAILKQGQTAQLEPHGLGHPEGLRDGEQPSDPDWSSPRCNSPQSHDEADLCAQRQAAKAAERVVTLNEVQILLGVVGTLSLFIALFYSRQTALAGIKAANAAETAANAARETVRAMREIDQRQSDDFVASLAATKAASNAAEVGAQASMRQASAMERSLTWLERPYIVVNVIDVTFARKQFYADQAEPKYWYVETKFDIRNYGRVPGLLVTGAIDQEIHRGLPIPPRYIRDIHFDRTPIWIAPGEAITHSRVCMIHGDREAQTMGQVDAAERFFVFFYGFVEYEDIFHTKRRRGFGYFYNQDRSRYEEIGGSDYNFEIEVKAESPVPQVDPGISDILGADFRATPPPAPERR